ncbi:MAG: hypothetical protein ACKO3M_13500 [Rubrivivax sp.]
MMLLPAGDDAAQKTPLARRFGRRGVQVVAGGDGRAGLPPAPEGPW